MEGKGCIMFEHWYLKSLCLWVNRRGIIVPKGPKGGRSNSLLRVRGWEDPIRTTGKQAWHSVYSVGSIIGLYYYLFKAVLVWIFMYFIQHCFICRPLDSTVSDDAGIEPGSVRRCNHWTHRLYFLHKLLFMTLAYHSACAWLLRFLRVPYLRKWRTQAGKWTPC